MRNVGAVHAKTAQAGTLYVVPTPIGNYGDITVRAIDVLRQAGIVASEDTRHARTLLRHLGIDARLVSYHEHNEDARSQELLAALEAGTDVALISDAGTPLVNDPGYRIVTGAIAGGIRVCPLPGTSAVLTALVGSGLPVHRFHYVGFLPRRQAARKEALTALADLTGALVCFEAPHRLTDMLSDMREVLGDRRTSLGCNLTKADERFIRGRLSELVAELGPGDAVRGEYTVVVEGAADGPGDADQELGGRLADALVRHGADARLTRDVVREVTGLPRNWVYERVRIAEDNHPESVPDTKRGGT
jgi:16S rRNA (cytidine1402-2'-O)-methyltransferase